MKEFNGHRSWNAWNVSLWINNDEALYRLALDCVRSTRTRREAAEWFLEHVGEGAKTPDGATYNITTVIAAIKEMK
jgi:hypothetical protein